MTYTLTIFRASGRIEQVEQKKVPDLGQLQKIVGGFIEQVPHFTCYGDYRRGTAFCCEDGLLRSMSLNERATAAWKECLGPGPFRYEPRLVGDVVFYARS